MVPLFKRSSRTSRFELLQKCPSLSETPELNILCPDGVAEVTKRFESEEVRIGNVAKIAEL